MPTYIRTGTARASSELPAAGAYDSDPVSITVSNYTEITPLFTYTRGGASGAVTFKILISNDNANFYQISELKSGTVTAGADTTDLVQRAEISYTATGDDPESFTGPTFTVAGDWFQIVCKESGNTGSPGTCFVEFMSRGEL